MPITRKAPGPTARARKKKRAQLVSQERHEKGLVRVRDRRCRFPHCGCQKRGANPLKAFLTVSHDFHKGMGGDPTGSVSIAALMVALCKWRHQDAPVSRHAGTLRTRYLTPDQNDGPIAFEVDLSAVYPIGPYRRGDAWFEVARETFGTHGSEPPWLLEQLTPEQEEVLLWLARMEW